MHREFMLAALEQAGLGRGVCAPNPCVGAVLVHENRIIARAWHQGAGTAHAEQRVLELAPEGLRGVTLYVTLEPCNHWGKTPPCVSTIIENGVSCVVYGFRDPNPLVAANDTPAILREEGIEVIHYPMDDIDAFYCSYARWTRTGKPWVTAKMAQSLDGKIAGPRGQRVPLSNALCSKFTHEQRLHTDIILTTAKTVINDDPLLSVRLEDIKKSKPVAIIDRRLSLPDHAGIFISASHCHIFHDSNIPVEHRKTNCSYHAMKIIDERVDLPAVIHQLGQLGYHDVWVEAGGTLFTALHEQALVQTSYLYIVPETLGPDAISAWHGTKLFQRPFQVVWQTMENNMIACLHWQED